MLTRRSVLASGAALLAAPAILRAQALSFTRFPFSLGVAAGDPVPDGFLIWTRLAPDPLAPHGGMPTAPVGVDWEVASDDDFRGVVARGSTVARPELGHSVHVEVSGLQPGRDYWYRFRCSGERSRAGRARTLPAYAARPDRFRLGVAGCQNYQQGFYGAYGHLARTELDAVYHYGDYIYEDGPKPLGTASSHGGSYQVVRQHAGPAIYTLDDYRGRYAEYKLDPDLQDAHAAAAWFCTLDDHEVEDNWAGDTDKRGTPPELFRLRREAAFQAWYEHMPVRPTCLPRGPDMRIARRVRIGDLVDTAILDTRQFRSDQPCGDDFKPACAAVFDARAQILGSDQERWLAETMRRSDARWNLVAQQVMVMALDRRTEDAPQPILNLDSWAGYAVPRTRILDGWKGRGNVVVLTGDEHQNFCGQVMDGDAAVAVEFVGTSISSGGSGQDKRPGTDRMMANNPHLSFMNDQRGFLVCDIGRGLWRTDYMVVDQVERRDSRLSKRASFAVERGAVKPVAA